MLINNQSSKVVKGEKVEKWTTKRYLQKPVPRDPVAYGRQLKIDQEDSYYSQQASRSEKSLLSSFDFKEIFSTCTKVEISSETVI